MPLAGQTLVGKSRVETIKKSRQAFVAKLSEENRVFYGSPDGLGLLNVIELSFDSRWVYLFELLQNALDARADSVSIQVAETGDALIFQHNGDRSLEEKDVEGLSKVFCSTKGARSVGFMGIGFKSVFTRFQEARVSGWEWRFKYKIAQEMGEEFGDIQRDFLGAVVPKWDDTIALPDGAYTTRFELRRRIDENIALASDLSHFLPDDSRAQLAILAMSGLKRLQIHGQIWELGTVREGDGNFEVTALSDNENLLWRVFEAEFQPSKAAIACFLEHRKIKPAQEARAQVYTEAARARRVLGVLPLDNEGLPMPPSRGRVYTTLPTEVTLPFGLHINADWLLNISRNGLREIEDNPWQRSIAREIADVLALFLKWSADTLRDPSVARAAFKVLARPSSEAGGLESILAEEGWLSGLRERIDDAAVIPVWTETPDTLAYATGRDTLVPPLPMAKAFDEQPDLSPARLLKGQVLMEEVLGRGAAGLLRDIGLLSDLLPEELEEIWKDGLEDWWKALPEESAHRRQQLFRLWAAIADLCSDDVWADLDLLCVRSVVGDWIAVRRATFLNEALPTEEEPGGLVVRRLMKPFVDDGNRLDTEWVASLRLRRSRDRDRGVQAGAWAWIEEHARSIGLREIAATALDDLALQTDPDWSVLVPFGQWTKYRDRADLLTHVLVRSDSVQFGVSVGDSLLADPYVSHGQDRRRLWPDSPAISPCYVETDPKGSSANEWRMFFENASAQGGVGLRAKKTIANRWGRKAVAAFLGYDMNDIPESNDSGYTLMDFDIAPPLPDSDAPGELRSALASWLEDGFRILKGKGRRKVTYVYYSQYELTGNLPSAWVTRLSQLAWVPCDDDELRLPEDALPGVDAAREDAPFAKLSPELLSTLDQEGVRFGTKIPEATSLRRLAKIGSQLDSAELSALVAECREEVATDVDTELLKRVLVRLRLPTVDSQRITLDRIVKRVGGRLRGALGGWVVPLDRIDDSLRAELEHADFPWDIPETTTGGQALDYIIDVWGRASSHPTALANEVRDVLPTAYAYCLDDSAKDRPLFDRWQSRAHEAMVFADREWLDLSDTKDVYLDDIDDRRFLPRQGEFRTVTGGHLGRSRGEQLRVAKAIRLHTLSSRITMEWTEGDGFLTVPAEWESRFGLVCELLRGVRGTESTEDDVEGVGVGAEPIPNLAHVGELSLAVSLGEAPAEVVPVNARLHEGTLTVAGHPLQFAADAAKELLRVFSFGQRAGLAADLTGMFAAIDNADFDLAAEKFRRSHAPALVLPRKLELGEVSGGNGRSEGESGEPHEPSTSNTEAGTDGEVQDGEAQVSRGVGEVDLPTSGGGLADQINEGDLEEPEREDLASMGGSYNKDRALAKQEALARELRRALKGEIVPAPPEGDSGEVATTDGADGDEVRLLGDEEYREAAAQYEREAGREPELGDPLQAGWDIRSTDPETQHVRLIEVKGRGRPWDGDEVVELSGAQIRKAFETGDSWYLYVVEKTDEGCHQVLPIANPVRLAGKWILCGESWRMVAENIEAVANNAESIGGADN